MEVIFSDKPRAFLVEMGETLVKKEMQELAMLTFVKIIAEDQINLVQS
jgi:hypothetical protein